MAIIMKFSNWRRKMFFNCLHFNSTLSTCEGTRLELELFACRWVSQTLLPLPLHYMWMQWECQEKSCHGFDFRNVVCRKTFERIYAFESIFGKFMIGKANFVDSLCSFIHGKSKETNESFCQTDGNEIHTKVLKNSKTISIYFSFMLQKRWVKKKV